MSLALCSGSVWTSIFCVWPFKASADFAHRQAAAAARQHRRRRKRNLSSRLVRQFLQSCKSYRPWQRSATKLTPVALQMEPPDCKRQSRGPQSVWLGILGFEGYRALTGFRFPAWDGLQKGRCAAGAQKRSNVTSEVWFSMVSGELAISRKSRLES